jgi:diguanylate cyclase (GGDEF)-like protein/PAS domain S-box-containing protein
MCAKDVALPVDSDRFYADLILRHSGDGVVVCDADRGTVWMNLAYSQQTGYALEDLLGKDPGELLQGPETCRETAKRIKTACRQLREIRVDILNYRADGQPFWVDLKITPIFNSEGVHTHFMSTIRDITERKVLEQQNEEMRHAEELRQSERQLLALTSEWLYSARSFDELLMVVKRAMHTLIPEAEGALYIYDDDRATLHLAAHWGSMPDFPAQILADECWALRRGRAYSYGTKPIQFTCDHVAKPGTPYFCLPIIAHGETIGLMHIVFDGFEEGGVMRHMRDAVLRNRWDISLICAEQISLAVANVRLRQELHERSIRDPLTGLWNRRWLMDRAGREASATLREGSALSLIILDVDHFKKFNDQYGHDAGDVVLREVGAVLSAHAGEQVLPCRLGGEEFVLLCPNTNADQARQQAERIREGLANLRAMHQGTALPQITASFGVASLPGHAQRVDQLLAAADRALYQAKAQGRNQTVVAELAKAGAS